MLFYFTDSIQRPGMASSLFSIRDSSSCACVLKFSRGSDFARFMMKEISEANRFVHVGLAQ